MRKLVKCDIEGAEKHLLAVSNLARAKEWLIEPHTWKLLKALDEKFRGLSYEVRIHKVYGEILSVFYPHLNIIFAYFP